MMESLEKQSSHSPTISRFENDDEFFSVVEKHVSRNDGTGLGREAVLSALLNARADVTEQPDFRYAQYTARVRSFFKRSNPEIKEIRQVVNTLSPEIARSLYEDMDNSFLKYAIFKDPNHFDAFSSNPIGSRINKKRLGLFGYKVKDESVLNLAEWLAAKTQARQAEFDKDVEKTYKVYYDKIGMAVERGWLPESALRNLKHVDATDMLEDDMFGTDVNEASGVYYSWHRGNKNEAAYILLSPDELEDERESTIDHELTHSLFNDHEAEASRSLLLSSVFGEVGATVIEEALVEHLSQSLRNGMFDVVNPNRRFNWNDAGTYFDCRAFIDMLVNEGEIKIDIRKLYEVLMLSQQTSLKGFRKDNKLIDLLDDFKKAFPKIDVVKELRSLKDMDDILEVRDEMIESTGLKYAASYRRRLIRKTRRQLAHATGFSFRKNK